MAPPPNMWLDLIILLGLNFVLYLHSLLVKNTFMVDFIWSGWPPILTYVIFLRLTSEETSQLSLPRLITLFPLIMVWGFRLTHNFLSRGGVGHEDWRYADMRVKFGKHFWWISLFSVYWGQTAFLWLPMLSIYGGVMNTQSYNSWDIVATLTCLAGIGLETFTDMSMNNFINLKKQKKTDKVILDTGLWALSRHPNYLGEICFWWGIYFFGVGYAEKWIIAGPLAITGLFFGVSVKLMEDRQEENKGEVFRNYKRKVGSGIILLPPSVNLWLGKKLYGEIVTVDSEKESLN